jgi:glyoxylase I family protein
MRPLGLNHVAYVTWDTGATVRFYTEVLGMKLVGHAEDSVPPNHFLHTFFEMEDGSCLAFFDIQGLPPEHVETPVPDWARHIALNVGSEDELVEWQNRLRQHNVDILAIKDHEGIWQSTYFYDPNGIRLELTYQRRPLGPAEASAAEEAVRQWTAGSSLAREA